MVAEQRIGIVIRRARERKRWTQKDLATALGVSRTTVDAWENDRTRPRNRTGALEDVLGISLNGSPAPERGPLADLEPFHDDDPMERQIAERATISDEDKAWLIGLRRAILGRRQQSEAQGRHRAS